MNINSYFTKQTDVKSIIVDHLDNAKKQVNIAVAWFTERTLFEKLLEIQDRGVNVELIITSHEFNNQSSNQYCLIEDKGGFFAEIGNDEQLMHMKFCVIDFDIVISGSANWSYRAFKENNEEVTIVSGNYKRANDFIFEFERLKLLSGKVKNLQKEIDISKAIKTLDLIIALINLGEIQSIQPYIHQIKNIPELELITNYLFNGQFDLASKGIYEFKKMHTQLISVTDIEKEQLRNQISLLSFQIEAMEVEKGETEALIVQFNHRFIIELNPVIAKIISLKKKIYEKLKKHGIIDETYETLDNEFKQKNKEFENEKKVEIPELNEQDIKTIKQLYREAVGWCHPDALNCIYEDKKKASEVFSELTCAYRANDINKVKYIWNELKLGKPISDIDKYNELDYLRSKFETLKMKYYLLVVEFQEIKNSETYQILSKIKDWDVYFNTQKIILKKEYDTLTQKYVNNEQ